MQIKKNLNIIIIFSSLALLLLFTRFYNLGRNPGFYGDECCYGEVGYNLIRGKLQYEGLKPTFFSTFMTQPPLFPALAGFLSLFLGKSILITRLISAIAASVTAFIIFLTTREFGAKKGSFFALIFFILHPETLLINRYGFTYNMGMVFLVCTFLFALKYFRTNEMRFLILTSIFAGVNLITVYYSIPVIIWFIALILLYDAKRCYMPLLSLIPILFLIGYYFLFDREIFLFDVKSMFSMASGEYGSLKYLPLKYLKLILGNPFFVISIAGLFLNLLGRKEKLFLGSFFLFSSFEILRQRDDIFILFYPVVFFVPILFISAGLFFEYILVKLSNLLEKIRKNNIVYIHLGNYLIYLLAFILVLALFYKDIRGLADNFDYQITKLSTSNTRDITKTAEFINEKCDNDSFVLTSIPVGFFLDCPHASLLQSAAYMGYKSIFYNYLFEKSRFYFDLTYTKARFLVILNVDRNWTLSVPGVTDIIKEITREKWKLVLSQGEVEIYENPTFN
jgi:hypothetical protein